MAVRIQLDRPHAHFTNLDFITGKVHMQLYTNETISNIVVKLEGESKTRLAVPDNEYDRRDRGRMELELHKVSACSQELHLDRGHVFFQSSLSTLYKTSRLRDSEPKSFPSRWSPDVLTVEASLT